VEVGGGCGNQNVCTENKRYYSLKEKIFYHKSNQRQSIYEGCITHSGYLRNKENLIKLFILILMLDGTSSHHNLISISST
jgi:hypothetical protein